MKNFVMNACAFLLFLGLLAGCGWVFLNPWCLILLIVTAPVVGPVLAGLDAVFSSQPPLLRSPPSAAPPPPIRQPDTLTPLIIGLALGWWLGGGPGDSDRDC